MVGRPRPRSISTMPAATSGSAVPTAPMTRARAAAPCAAATTSASDRLPSRAASDATSATSAWPDAAVRVSTTATGLSASHGTWQAWRHMAVSSAAGVRITAAWASVPSTASR
jgi:hypothetical protein